MYAKCLKRVIDFLVSLCALLVLLPLFAVLTVLGTVFMKGNPFFTQLRPGRKDASGKEVIFKLLKFRTMTNEKDASGNLLPDDRRLNGYGRFLRSTSLDELPQLINILKGDMAIIGPRPQLVRDMVFMTEEQRHRHDVLPGLSGLAQIRGRNAISWENKLATDLEYIQNVSFSGDVRIITETVKKVLKCEGISEEGMETAEDFGDYLLRNGKITSENYEKKQDEAMELLKNE